MQNQGRDLDMFVRTPRDFMKKPVPQKPATGPVLLICDPHVEHIGNFIAMCAGMSYLKTAKLPEHVYDTASDLDLFLEREIGVAGLVIAFISKKAAQEPHQPLVRFTEHALEFAVRWEVPAIVYVESPESLESLQMNEAGWRIIKCVILGFVPKQKGRKIARSINTGGMAKVLAAPQIHEMRSAIAAQITSSVRRE